MGERVGFLFGGPILVDVVEVGSRVFRRDGEELPGVLQAEQRQVQATGVGAVERICLRRRSTP